MCASKSNTSMITITFTNHCYSFTCVGLTLPSIIDEPVHFLGKSSPYPALGPEPKNLISLDIFIRATAHAFNDPEKLTTACAANSANLFGAGLKGNFVNFEISLTIFYRNFF